MRCDLTINAMAQDADGKIIDPFGGQRTAAGICATFPRPSLSKTLSASCVLLRFAARYRFEIAEETIKLMRQMVENGEADAFRCCRTRLAGVCERFDGKPRRKMIEVLQ